MPWAIIKYDYLKYARKTIFPIFKILSVCVANGMYLIEQAGVIIYWIIAYKKMTFTLYKNDFCISRRPSCFCLQMKSMF